MSFCLFITVILLLLEVLSYHREMRLSLGHDFQKRCVSIINSNTSKIPNKLKETGHVLKIYFMLLFCFETALLRHIAQAGVISPSFCLSLPSTNTYFTFKNNGEYAYTSNTEESFTYLEV